MASEYVDRGIPFLRSQNIEPFRIRLDDVKYVRPAFHERLKKCALRPGDVAVIRTGYPGVAAVIPESLIEANCADLVVITPSPALDSHYLASIFNSTWGKSAVAGNLVGVAQQHFNVGAARNLEVMLPPIETQRRIAGILSAYDDLIENCERRIRVLDEMARALYREWFVNFRYPGHENVPLVESAMGRIPKGWSVRPLSEVVDVNAAQVDTKHPPGRIRYIDISSVSPGSVDAVADLVFAQAPGRARRIVRHGDVVWSCVRPNRRSHALVLHPDENTVASTGFAVLSAKSVPFTYLYSATTTDEFVSYLEKRATGAAYPAVTGKVFADAPGVDAILILGGEFPRAELLHETGGKTGQSL